MKRMEKSIPPLNGSLNTVFPRQYGSRLKIQPASILPRLDEQPVNFAPSRRVKPVIGLSFSSFVYEYDISGRYESGLIVVWDRIRHIKNRNALSSAS